LRQAKEGIAVEQSLGEQLIQGLLAGEMNAKLASDTAAAWRGDDLFAFVDGEQTTTAWYSAWTSPDQAAAFQRVYQKILERRQHIRFETPTGSLTNLSLSGRTPDNRGVWLQVQGPVMLFLGGVPIDRLRERAEEAWQDLEIGSEPTAIRFELARQQRRRHQLSLNQFNSRAGFGPRS
jgi:hypothetical protein